MRHRDAFLELLSPALARARRERRGRTTIPVARPVPCPGTVTMTQVLRPR